MRNRFNRAVNQVKNLLGLSGESSEVVVPEKNEKNKDNAASQSEAEIKSTTLPPVNEASRAQLTGSTNKTIWRTFSGLIRRPVDRRMSKITAETPRAIGEPAELDAIRRDHSVIESATGKHYALYHSFEDNPANQQDIAIIKEKFESFIDQIKDELGVIDTDDSVEADRIKIEALKGKNAIFRVAREIKEIREGRKIRYEYGEFVGNKKTSVSPDDPEGNRKLQSAMDEYELYRKLIDKNPDLKEVIPEVYGSVLAVNKKGEETVNTFMEIVKGKNAELVAKDLAKLANGTLAEKQLRDDRLIEVSDHFLLAVAKLHAAGIYHRDLKLDNFMVDEKNNNHVKIIDLGSAIYSQAEEMTVVSSQAYRYHFPPEYFFDLSSDFEKFDSWAAGLTILELAGADLKKLYRIIDEVNLLTDKQFKNKEENAEPDLAFINQKEELRHQFMTEVSESIEKANLPSALKNKVDMLLNRKFGGALLHNLASGLKETTEDANNKAASIFAAIHNNQGKYFTLLSPNNISFSSSKLSMPEAYNDEPQSIVVSPSDMYYASPKILTGYDTSYDANAPAWSLGLSLLEIYGGDLKEYFDALRVNVIPNVQTLSSVMDEALAVQEQIGDREPDHPDFQNEDGIKLWEKVESIKTQLATLDEILNQNFDAAKIKLDKVLQATNLPAEVRPIIEGLLTADAEKQLTVQKAAELFQQTDLMEQINQTVNQAVNQEEEINFEGNTQENIEQLQRAIEQEDQKKAELTEEENLELEALALAGGAASDQNVSEEEKLKETLKSFGIMFDEEMLEGKLLDQENKQDTHSAIVVPEPPETKNVELEATKHEVEMEKRKAEEKAKEAREAQAAAVQRQKEQSKQHQQQELTKRQQQRELADNMRTASKVPKKHLNTEPAAQSSNQVIQAKIDERVALLEEMKEASRRLGEIQNAIQKCMLLFKTPAEKQGVSQTKPALRT